MHFIILLRYTTHRGFHNCPIFICILLFVHIYVLWLVVETMLNMTRYLKPQGTEISQYLLQCKCQRSIFHALTWFNIHFISTKLCQSNVYFCRHIVECLLLLTSTSHIQFLYYDYYCIYFFCFFPFSFLFILINNTYMELSVGCNLEAPRSF